MQEQRLDCQSTAFNVGSCRGNGGFEASGGSRSGENPVCRLFPPSPGQPRLSPGFQGKSARSSVWRSVHIWAGGHRPKFKRFLCQMFLRFYKLGFFSQSFELEIEDWKKIFYVTRNPWCERAAVGSRAGLLYPAQERTFGTRHCPHVFTTSLSRMNHQLFLFGF